MAAEISGLLTGWGLRGPRHPDWPHLDDAARARRDFDSFPGNDAFVHTDARDDNF